MKFRFVDTITGYRENDFIEGIKAVSLEEYLLLTRFGSRKRFPPTLMAEALFQLANFLVYKSFHTKLAILTMFKRIEIRQCLGPGDRMRMRVDLESVIGESVKMRGSGFVSDREVITGEGCIGVLVDLERLYDPEDYAALFDRLYAPEENMKTTGDE